MNKFVFPLILLAAAFPKVSGNDISGNDDGGGVSSHIVKSRPMLRKRNNNVARELDEVIMAEKEANRDDTIPDLEETTIDDEDEEEDRILRSCSNGQKYFRLEIKTDNYGFESSWKLMKKNGNSWSKKKSGPPGNTKYGAKATYVGGFCLSSGQYQFQFSDLFRDGMNAGTKGYYKITVDGVQKGSAPSDRRNWAKRVHQFTIGGGNNNGGGSGAVNLPFSPRGDDMTNRDSLWLNAHNTRRKKYHEANGKSYNALQWSNILKQQSKQYAQQLLSNCSLKHDDNNQYGENLASNYGTGSYGALKHPNQILTRWTEDEMSPFTWPASGHMTQVLWRATTHVGCGEAEKTMSGGKTCRTQVCRYARPGNCDMGSHKNGSSNWWKKPVFADSSGCTPFTV